MNSAKSRKRFEKKYHLKDRLGWDFVKMAFTFALVCLGLVFFRAESVTHAVDYISGIFSASLFTMPHVRIPGGEITLLFIAIFMLVEWFGRENQYAIEKLTWKYPILCWIFYYAIIIAIIKNTGNSQQFIYFQF